MFLITTADQRFWKIDRKVLFLGEWCKRYTQRHIWSNLDYEVLPYHWNNRTKLYQDYLYLQTVYERYLALLAQKLNEFHRIDHSLRFWRIVIGPWLDQFIPVLYDRYLSIYQAAKTGKVTNTWITSTSGAWTPEDYSRFSKACISDQYNHYLYSQLIKALDCIPFEIKEQKGDIALANTNGSADKYNLKSILFKLLEIYSRRVPDRWNKIVFIASYIDWQKQMKLQLDLGQWPYWLTSQIVPRKVSPNTLLRKQLFLDQGRNQFETILDNLIVNQIPTVYVEEYPYLLEKSLELYPKHPKVIFTANAHNANEGFKLWAAHQVERGAKLIIGQHGGFYGSGLWASFEKHEISISDCFYTWGWHIESEPKTMPLPATKLIQLHKIHLKPYPKGFILWIAMSLPRYVYYMQATPIGSQVLAYLDEQRRFLEAVSPAVHEMLLLRLYLHEYGWDEAKRWQNLDPTLKLYQGAKSMLEQARESRLVISTYNATTYLETLAANFPSILFWNPSHWELRPAAQPYFDELRRVGILHNTPESAATKVNEVYSDPLSWWCTPEVQAAKDHFCTHFAKTSNNWLQEWKIDLLKQANKQVG